MAGMPRRRARERDRYATDVSDEGAEAAQVYAEELPSDPTQITNQLLRDFAQLLHAPLGHLEMRLLPEAALRVKILEVVSRIEQGRTSSILAAIKARRSFASEEEFHRALAAANGVEQLQIENEEKNK